MTTISIEIKDWYEIHHGFTLNLNPGYTALVGPNGAGKTTLLEQIKEYADKNNIKVFYYSNLRDGGQTARQKYLMGSKMDFLATSMLSSEGEQITINFGAVVGKMGNEVRNAIEESRPLIILLDSLDSGTSIDNQREYFKLFKLIEKDIKEFDADIYIVNAVNAYEMVRKKNCINARTGEKINFKTYNEYSDWICSFMKNFSYRKRKKKE